MKRLVPVFLLCLLMTAPAWAHAVLVDSTPGANAAVQGGHLRIVLHFNSRVDGKRSQLTLISLSGQTHVALEQQLSPDTLSAAETTLKPGAYRLIWQVLAADGHLTRGQIPFKVR